MRSGIEDYAYVGNDPVNKNDPMGTNPTEVASSQSSLIPASDEFGTTSPVSVSGSRAIDQAQSYEQGVQGLYGDVSFAQRQFEGDYGAGVADSVFTQGQDSITAVEAKYTENWANSIQNPNSPIGGAPFAVQAQQNMVTQALNYSSVFNQTVYHTNSVDLASYYTSVFNQAGVQNFSFVITPAVPVP